MLKRLAYASALLCAFACAALAGSTATTTVTNGSYTDLGAGPYTIENRTQNAINYCEADSLPSASLACHILLGGQFHDFQTTSHVYAQTLSVGATALVVTSPLQTGSGGGSFTWPGTAAATNYGTAPTGTVPAVNAAVTNFPTTQAVSWSGQTVGITGSVAVTGTFWQTTQPASVADGSDTTQGAKADAAYSGSGSASVVSILKGIYTSLGAGTAVPGKWTAGAGQGLTWGTAINAADVNSLASGSAVLSSVADIANGTALDSYADLSIQLGSMTVAAPAYLGVFLYPLNSDGTTYGDNQLASGTGAAKTPSAGYWVGNIAVPTGTATVKGALTGIKLPPGSFRFVVFNQLGAAIASSGNTIQYRTYNRIGGQ